MSHYHLEIVMPPVKDVTSAIAEIMKPFDEQAEEDEDSSSFKFWDWYQIGGRYSGIKIEAILGTDKIEDFNEVLRKEKITVSGITRGKPTLSPSSQIDKVNGLWNTHFPDSPVKTCPLFDNYKEKFGDIMCLGDMPKDLKAYAVIVAEPKFDAEGYEAGWMIHSSMWNGVTHVDTKWDGLVSTAVNDYKKWMEGWKSEHAATRIPQDDWIVVTVDYHS